MQWCKKKKKKKQQQKNNKKSRLADITIQSTFCDQIIWLRNMEQSLLW